MKISDIRASLQRLAERLDNQWAYARSDAEMDIAAGRAEYNDDGERLPTEPESRTTSRPASRNPCPARNFAAWSLGNVKI